MPSMGNDYIDLLIIILNSCFIKLLCVCNSRLISPGLMLCFLICTYEITHYISSIKPNTTEMKYYQHKKAAEDREKDAMVS